MSEKLARHCLWTLTKRHPKQKKNPNTGEITVLRALAWSLLPGKPPLCLYVFRMAASLDTEPDHHFTLWGKKKGKGKS